MEVIEARQYLDNLRRKLVAPDTVLMPSSENAKAAAVLLLLVSRESGLHVIYTRRSERLSSHRGQVAFPGGRFDKCDRDLMATALRETYEEVGLAPGSIEILGSFEGRATRSSSIFVTPFVGIAREPFELRPDPKEVAEIFEVPLVALTDRSFRGYHDWINDGSPSRHPAILHEGQVIWGLTYYLTLRFLDLSRRAQISSRFSVTRRQPPPLAVRISSK